MDKIIVRTVLITLLFVGCATALILLNPEDLYSIIYVGLVGGAMVTGVIVALVAALAYVLRWLVFDD